MNSKHLLLAALIIAATPALAFALDCAGALRERATSQIVEVTVDGVPTTAAFGPDESFVLTAAQPDNIQLELLDGNEWQGEITLVRMGASQ